MSKFFAFANCNWDFKPPISVLLNKGRHLQEHSGRRRGRYTGQLCQPSWFIHRWQVYCLRKIDQQSMEFTIKKLVGTQKISSKSRIVWYRSKSLIYNTHDDLPVLETLILSLQNIQQKQRVARNRSPFFFVSNESRWLVLRSFSCQKVTIQSRWVCSSHVKGSVLGNGRSVTRSTRQQYLRLSADYSSACGSG